MARERGVKPSESNALTSLSSRSSSSCVRRWRPSLAAQWRGVDLPPAQRLNDLESGWRKRERISSRSSAVSGDMCSCQFASAYRWRLFEDELRAAKQLCASVT